NCLAGVFTADPELSTRLVRPPADYAPAAAPAAATAAGISQSNLQHLDADLGAANSGTRTFATKVLDSLGKAAAEGTVAQLLIYQPGSFDGQGRASISVGDVATARHVAILTPGILSSPSDMNGTIALAGNLKSDAEKSAPGESTAVVVWFGYDIPGSAGKDSVDQGGIGDTIRLLSDTTKALDARTAQSGGTLLAADTRWVKKLSSPGSSITMIGHSMGSVVTSEAARYSIPADNMVLLAAPGAGYDAQSASDYASVDPDQVFVLSFPQDPVTLPETDLGATLGDAMIDGPNDQQPYGTDPAGHLFGGQQIDASSNHSIMFDGGSIYDSHGMDNYLGGAAGLAVARVVTGRTSKVNRKEGR
ncbi:MAG: alpha/beta hydrolase family protein, partial [Actinomycetota bacterium]|nr:alpha/beta hydrolase family protein [Actinomycetota bacterium]